MPYRSNKQSRFMHEKKPKIAKRWDKKYGKKIVRPKAKSKHGKEGNPYRRLG